MARPPVSLDVNRLEQHFIRRSIEGADKAAGICLARARKHAPVRQLFRGTTFRQGEFGPTPRQHRFRTSTSTGNRVGRLTNQEARSERDQHIGHANSEIPVFRFPQGSFSGDFRRVRIRKFTNTERDALETMHPRDIRRIQMTSSEKVPVTINRRQGGRTMVTSGKLVSAGELRNPRGQRLLTSRGRYEIRTGRAVFKAPGGKARVGGRLKNELYVEKATYAAGHVWAYVVSPTKDPETGYPYPRAMEFGSAHNRPHPFLRPGLHESRNDLRRAVKQFVKAGPQVK